MKKKTTFYWILGGGFFGGTLSSWLAPKVIAWYFDPPVNIGVNCRSAVEWAMGRLRIMQLIGIGIGMFLTGLLIFMRRHSGGNGDINLSPGSRID